MSKRKPSRILQFPGPVNFRQGATVTQEDLMFHFMRKHALLVAKREYSEIHSHIKTALKKGACVEDGVFTAELVSRPRRLSEAAQCEILSVHGRPV